MPSLINLTGGACPPAASISELLAWGLGQQWGAFCICFFFFLWLFQYFTVARGRSAVLAPVGWAWLSGLGQLLLGLQITHLENEELGRGGFFS